MSRNGEIMGLLKHLIKSAYYRHRYHNNKYGSGFQDHLGHSGFIGISPLLHNFFKKRKKLVYILFAGIGLVFYDCSAHCLVSDNTEWY
jgi:hypothetical protein